ncbi:hypothetical protein J3R83DRAFT_7135 [Lanmaoa asiatica]|nr:hypothetical protein J3R83DRAFT_7135 [Lanmaoa asiatica]
MTTTRRTPIDEQTTQVALAPSLVWNAVAPVSRLPLEILAYIFIYCARRDYHESWDEMGVPQWVNVSYVCGCWRYVALSCPTLWSYMFIASPRWTEALLIRSKEVPLWVHVDFSPINRKVALEFMAQVTPYAERFRECRLDLQSEDADLVLPMLSSRSAPLLHILAITCKHLPYYWNHVDVDAEVNLDMDEGSQAISPHVLFNGDTPALRELHLKDYLISWCSPTLSGLTVLRLRDLHYSVRPTIAELRLVLSRMPDLAQLHLDNAIRGGLRDPARLDAEQVHLPRLAYLWVVAPFSRIVRFLSCIDIPVKTRVRLGCRLETHPDWNDYAAFYGILSQRFSNPENEATSVAPIRTMIMDNASQHMFIIFSKSERPCCGHQKCNWSFFKDCDCDVPLKIDIDRPSHTEHWNELVVGICRSVPLACLKNLILDGCRLPSVVGFDIVLHLPELRYIESIGGDLADITLLLSLFPRPLPESADKPADQRASQPFAPSLQELCLNGVSIPRGIRCGGNPSIHGSHVVLFRDALMRRRAAGHELERLLINGSLSFTRKEVVYLGEVVSRIGVDGFARLPDDEYCEDCEGEAFEELGIYGLPGDDSF